MKRSALLTAFSLLILSHLGCGHKKVIIEETKVTKNDVVKFNVILVKDKGKKFDIELGIANTSPKDIIIKTNEMKCFKGQTEGMLKQNSFSNGDRVILHPSQEKIFKMICVTNVKDFGEYRIILSKVYDSAKDESVAENVELKLGPAAK